MSTCDLALTSTSTSELVLTLKGSYGRAADQRRRDSDRGRCPRGPRKHCRRELAAHTVIIFFIDLLQSVQCATTVAANHHGGQRARRSKVAHCCSRADVLVRWGRGQWQNGFRECRGRSPCLYNQGPSRTRNRIRGENASSPGRRSLDISIVTSRRFGDGKSAGAARSSAAPFEARLDLRLRQRTGCCGLRAGGKRATIAGAATTGASESSERSRPPALSAGGAHEAVHLTGRGEELELLRSSWERAARGAAAGRGRHRRASASERRASSWNLRDPLPGTRPCSSDVATARRCVAYAPWVTILQWMIRTTPAQALRQHLAAIDAGVSWRKSFRRSARESTSAHQDRRRRTVAATACSKPHRNCWRPRHTVHRSS